MSNRIEYENIADRRAQSCVIDPMPLSLSSNEGWWKRENEVIVSWNRVMLFLDRSASSPCCLAGDGLLTVLSRPPWKSLGCGTRSWLHTALHYHWGAEIGNHPSRLRKPKFRVMGVLGERGPGQSQNFAWTSPLDRAMKSLLANAEAKYAVPELVTHLVA